MRFDTQGRLKCVIDNLGRLSALIVGIHCRHNPAPSRHLRTSPPSQIKLNRVRLGNHFVPDHYASLNLTVSNPNR